MEIHIEWDFADVCFANEIYNLGGKKAGEGVRWIPQRFYANIFWWNLPKQQNLEMGAAASLRII